ncbi:hypothetical protein ACFX15_029340 [Malus domestica]|uniref:Uncharacterized protein n=1 Tax=Malus domestica TaxID=3750 RepID=A0A498K8Z0_MALDO|nr:hypothetical protein DVH24_039024 [Malus domestica]
MIHPSVDQIALAFDANGLKNTDDVRELLGATISHADFKGACTSLKDFIMRCYGSLCEQTLDDVHKAEITLHIDLATVEEVKAKDYQESFEKVGDELRLKRQAEAEEDQALIALKEKSKCVLVSEWST